MMKRRGPRHAHGEIPSIVFMQTTQSARALLSPFTEEAAQFDLKTIRIPTHSNQNEQAPRRYQERMRAD